MRRIDSEQYSVLLAVVKPFHIDVTSMAVNEEHSLVKAKASLLLRLSVEDLD